MSTVISPKDLRTLAITQSTVRKNHLRRLAVTQTTVKKLTAKARVKSYQKSKIILIMKGIAVVTGTLETIPKACKRNWKI